MPAMKNWIKWNHRLWQLLIHSSCYFGPGMGFSCFAEDLILGLSMWLSPKMWTEMLGSASRLDPYKPLCLDAQSLTFCLSNGEGSKHLEVDRATKFPPWMTGWSKSLFANPHWAMTWVRYKYVLCEATEIWGSNRSQPTLIQYYCCYY